MKIVRRRSSISVDFFLFSLLIFSAVTLVSIGFWLQVYGSELHKKQEQLSTEAMRINSVLTDAVDYISQYTTFVGEKIAQQHNSDDLHYIATLLSTRTPVASPERTSYLTTTFDWVTPDKMLRVSNKIGILPAPFDMSDRDYLQRTPVRPWALQLSSPRIGGLSRQWVVPAGMGITDEQGKFLGSITLGFSLNGLQHRIAQALGNTDARYLIIDDHKQLVIDSRTDSALGPDPKFALEWSGMETALREPSGYLANMIKNGDTEYSYFIQLPQYPYIVLVGYRADMASSLFNQIVLSRGMGLISIVVAALVMLYLMRQRLIQPVMKLAQKADRISRGEPVSILDSSVHEIVRLDRELQKIATYIQNEHRINQQLETKTRLLETATKDALAARDAAVKADQAKMEFLANMSHELRTPMNAVVGLTNVLLMRRHPPERLQEYLQVMNASSQQLLQLINDLLDTSKLESEQVELENIPFDLKATIEEVVLLHSLKAKEKDLEFRVDAKWPATALLGDPLRLKQILNNLVSNAIKFTDKGSVIIGVESITSSATGLVDLVITVKDTGIGVPENKLESIFNKFSQADTSITRKFGGTGLGLSICKQLVDIMHGHLSVQNAPGGGSCFILRLSLPKATGQVAVQDSVSAADSALERHPDFKVLLVEDNSDNILVVSALLETYGYPFELARSGQEALQRVEKESFALILMDIQMPGMDGYTTTRAIREQEQKTGRAAIPIIGMTAYALSGDKERCLAAGMNDYMSKPCDPERFYQMLRNASALFRKAQVA